MKLNEEAIGGREGYLQRLVREDVQGVRGGSSRGRVAQSVRDYRDGLESGGPDRAGERDGVEPSGYPGDSGR